MVVVIIFILIILSQRAKRERQRQAEKAKLKERKRIEECGDVVLWFANNMGYIARKAISRDDLEQFIDAGISPDDLVGEIYKRIDAIDGMVIGSHQVAGMVLPVKLTQEVRDRHMYIIGKSGSGKTTLLRNMILQDIWNGNGVGVIAPEQEMIVDELLPYIPEHRIDDVVYVNPADSQQPVSFNPLQFEEGEDIDLKVDENLSIFKRLWGGNITSRMEEILRQSFYALMPTPDTTLLDIPLLLDRENPHYRKQIIVQLSDPDTIHFWQDTYPQFPKDAHLPIVHRLGRLTHAKAVKNILCQRDGNINFRNLVDDGKIVLFNLSDGILGEANSQLLGQLVVSKFQLTIMARANIPQSKRRRFYLYIDEFQTFTSTATASYEKILSRARKYRLALILAHQQTGQIPSNLLREIFGNVSTMLSFVVSSDDTRKLAREFISEWNGEIVQTEPDKLLALKVGQAYCRIVNNSFPVQTFPITEKPDYDYRNYIIERSQELYGTKTAHSVAPQDTVDTERMNQKKISTDQDIFGDADPSQVFE